MLVEAERRNILELVRALGVLEVAAVEEVQLTEEMALQIPVAVVERLDIQPVLRLLAVAAPAS